MTDRSITVLPLLHSRPSNTAGSVHWAASSGGWGEFGAYRLVRDGDHAWSQRLGGFVEFARWEDRGSFYFVGDIEFIADHQNNIAFNPRAIFWQEAFIYAWSAGSSFAQVGYVHRCKHDIDNMLQKEQRTLIYGSIQGRYTFLFGDSAYGRPDIVSLRADLFTLRQDDALPFVAGEDRWSMNRLLGALSLHYNGEYPLKGESLTWVFSGWASAALFGTKDGFISRFSGVSGIRSSGGASLGFAVRGGTEIRVMGTYERVADTGIPARPRSSDLLSFSIFILDPLSMR